MYITSLFILVLIYCASVHLAVLSGYLIEIVVNLKLAYNNNKTGLQPVSKPVEQILVFFQKCFYSKKGANLLEGAGYLFNQKFKAKLF